MRAKDFAVAAAAGDRRLVEWLGAALAVRLALLPWFSDPYNFRVFDLTASFVESGQNPWVVISSDPALASVNPWGYPPLYLVPVLAASALSFGNGLAFGILIRLPLMAASLLTAIFVQRGALALGLDATRARRAAIAYAFNPFVVLVDTVWGANDPLPALCTAACFYMLVRKPARPDSAALALGVGIAFKLYPLVLVPLALAALPRARARLRFMALAAFPAAITVGPLMAASPGQFLGIVGIFLVGGAGPPSPMTFGYLASTTAPASPVVTWGLAGAYGALVVGCALAHRRGKLPLVNAWALSLLALYLVAPRLIENYFLWPVAGLVVAGAVGAGTAATRWAGYLFWAPAALSAFLYNGARGIAGPFYWAWISGAPPGRPYTWVPPETRQVLTALAFLLAAVALAGLVRHPRARAAGDGAPPRPRLRAFAAGPPPWRAALAAGLAVCLVATAVVAQAGRPVGPDAFATYSFTAGRAIYVDGFDSALLDQTWTYGGSGTYELVSSDGGLLVLDTRVPRGNSYITRAVPNTTVEVAVSARFERVDGAPGLLLVARTPSGWIGVANRSQPSSPSTYSLLFFDETANRSHTLGSPSVGAPFTLVVRMGPNGTEVAMGGTSARGPLGGPPLVVLGQRDAGQQLGGRLVLDQVQISWDAPLGASAPLLGPAAFLLGCVALAVPVFWWRSRPT